MTTERSPALATPPAPGRSPALATPPAPGRSPLAAAVASLDLDDLDDPRVLAVGWVPAGAAVLDLGTGDAAVPATLRRTGCKVQAVEIDPVLAAGARGSCDRVVVADLETLDLGSAFGHRSAQVVLALDVLGWLRDPAGLLRRVVDEVLDPDGWIVMTLPNVKHASVRLRLLAGQFLAGRAVEGHSGIGGPLRHFDPAACDALLSGAGLVSIGRRSLAAGIDAETAALAGEDPGLLRRLQADPEAMTATYLVAAVPAGSPLLEDPPLLPAASAQGAALDAIARAKRIEDRLAELEAQHETLEGILPVLGELRAASVSRRATLRTLLRMLEGNLEAIDESAR